MTMIDPKFERIHRGCRIFGGLLAVTAVLGIFALVIGFLMNLPAW